MPAPLLTTVRRTAALLGVGWRAAPHDTWHSAVMLTGPRPGRDPYRIRITRDGQRLTAYGHLDKADDRRLLHSADAPQISVTADMPARHLPRHLASHLRRRFLPGYAEALDAVAADRNRYAQQTQARDDLTRLLADVLPHSRIATAYNSEHWRQVIAHNILAPSPRITALIQPDASHVDMNLTHLTPAQAEAVARLLAPDV
ncbi:hypothetical protein OG897_32400 [Streptomyces sp. NBC_00237]|uniref:hypothetical protein n=1 Tax=Streptomyces sp. NBC_00237 TaxID=2975687 RepID=UPI00224D0EBB|nr:hypothetical protein [Streptomyces sp. NBC_00237]MCX5206100.1 hypothetical protein [Streptomyces sp. NBC_00237]